MKKKMVKVILFSLFLFSMILNGEYIKKEKAIKMLQEVKQSDFPVSNNVYISNELEVRDMACMGYEKYEEYRLVLNDKARKNNKVSFYKDVRYSDIVVEKIEIIKKDGRVISFDPDKILVQKDSPGQSNIYSNDSKILTAQLPNIEVGDIIYTVKKITTKKQIMENNMFDMFSIEDYSTYLNKYLELRLPKDKKLYIHELNKKDFKYEHSTTIEGDTKIYKWNAYKNPLIVYEPNMEDFHHFAHHIKMTTVEKWEDISKWYYNIVKPHMIMNDDIKAKVKELVRDAKSRKEKAGNIFYWVARNIRYLGVDKEDNRPGFEPHDTDYTFETRGGVCRDKAALLTMMLREAGIGSDVILISAGSRLNIEAPMVWFNHAITVSYDDKGEPEFQFDPTNETTKDFLPKYEEDNTYLIASEKGNTLNLTPTSAPKDNNSTINISLKVNKDNSAEGKIEFLFSGLSDTFIRGRYTRMDSYQFKETIESYISRFHPNAVLVDFTNSDPNDKSMNMKITANIKIKDYIKKTQYNSFIPLEASRMNLHFLYNYVLRTFNISSRNYDFVMPGAFSFDIKTTVDYFEDFANVSVPKIETLDFMGFKTEIESNIKKNILTMNYHFDTSKLHFKKEQFQELRKKIASLSKTENLYLIGETGGRDE